MLLCGDSFIRKNGINTNTHAGTRQMFGLHFVKTGIITKESGMFYSAIFSSRQASDYEDLIEPEKEKVLQFVEPANTLITEIEKLLAK